MQQRQSPAERISAARTFLFVPGDRPERFDKAAASGADLVVLDLEDAVAPSAKQAAREVVRAWLSAERGALVRINAAGTVWLGKDLELSKEVGLLGFMLPKAEAGVTLARVAGLKPTVALIESAAGVATVQKIAGVPGVKRLAYGTIDLALDLETSCDDVLLTIGTQIVVASRSNGLASPIDGVTAGFMDPTPVEEAMRRARKRGFGAKLCIHPAQLQPVRMAFSPTIQELEWARRVVDADQASGGAAVAVDGQMVDKPVVARAYRTLADADVSKDAHRELRMNAPPAE
ncbi:MAG: CoA ester lyase [Caulobacter sp.]|nr:CoA ester lyase [Caulobacter sp.]